MSKSPPPFFTTTGDAAEYLPPAGQARDDLLNLVRLGLSFRAQQAGKRPGALAGLVLDRARRAGPPYSFAQLLDELETDAAQVGADVCSPCDSVNRVRELAVFHLPCRGRAEVPFGTLRRHLTTAKIILKSENSHDR